MVHVPVVYGKWVMRDWKWYFELDHPKGARMFFLSDGTTHGELNEIAREEYNLLNTELVELAYMLPDSMTQMMDKDSTIPPIQVTNDRQVRALVELSKTHCVRLCVSSRMVMTTEPKEEVADEEVEDWFDENDDEGLEFEEEANLGGNCDVEVEDWIDENDDKGLEFEEEGGDGVGLDVEADDQLDEGEVIDSYLKDYSVYGKVKDEDSDEGEGDDDRRHFAAGGSYVGEGRRPTVGWSDGVSLDKCFPTKDALIKEVHVTALMCGFAFKVKKSTKRTYLAVCRVPGCVWRVKGGVKNEPDAFFVMIYSQYHTCTVDDRVLLKKRYAPRYIAELFWSEWKTVEGVTPAMIASVIHGKLGLTLSYTTAYRALMFARQKVMGTPEEGYERLPAYLHRLKLSNPDTVTDLVVDEENKFKYVLCVLQPLEGVLSFSDG